MAGFNNIYITTVGRELAAKTLEGKKLEFTVARLGDGTLADSSVDAIKAKTELENTIIEVAISGAKQTSETQTTISFVFQNTEASGPFYFREIGIFALDPDTSDEVLFAYSYAGDEAEYINNSVSEIVEKEVNIVVTVDNASEVTITLDSNQIYVTEKELEEKLDEYVKQDEFNIANRTSIDSITIEANTTITNAYEVTLPLYYQVGNNSLELRLNSEVLKLATETEDGHYKEIGTEGELSNKIQFYRTSEDGDWTLSEDVLLTAIVRGVNQSEEGENE